MRRGVLEAVAPVEEAGPEDQPDDHRRQGDLVGVKPWMQELVGETRVRFENWKMDWLNHRPIAALTAIHVGARSQTCELRSSSPVPAPVDAWPVSVRARPLLGVGSTTPKRVDQRTRRRRTPRSGRTPRDRGPRRAAARPRIRCRSRQGRRFEARRGLASQDLVAGRDRGDVPKDRRACSRRSRHPRAGACHRGARNRRQAGQDHRGRPEGRTEQHDPMVSQPVGEHPEHRREDQLRGVERDVEPASVVVATTGPPCSGSFARYEASIAPVRPVLNRSVKVPASTAWRERSIVRSVAAADPSDTDTVVCDTDSGLDPARIMPATFGAAARRNA